MAIVELNRYLVQHYLTRMEEVVGRRWINRKVREEFARQSEDQRAVENRKHRYLFRGRAHPLVEWLIETKRWLNDADCGKQQQTPKSAIRLSCLGKSLDSVFIESGFSRILGRLKQRDQFFSASFEVEVASIYKDMGWSIEFVAEEVHKKTPDLKITRSDGVYFWVECKCRDQIIGRVKTLTSIWNELHASLLSYLGPRKLNVVVLVNCLDEPDMSDIPALRAFIREGLQEAGRGTWIDRDSYTWELDPTGRYEVVAHVLAPPDGEVDEAILGFLSHEEFEHLSCICEKHTDLQGVLHLKNLSIFGFKTNEPSDGVPGILNAFKSAVEQLPKGGPGVVWIRVPDAGWGSDFDGFFGRCQRALKAELSGTKNQRVNVTILMTRDVGYLETALSYRSLQFVVEHSNPRWRTD